MAKLPVQCPIGSLVVVTNGPASPLEDGKALLVDFGGRGQNNQDVRAQWPELKGLRIVQNLSQEIVGQEAVKGAKAMSYDFFRS